jgi:pimeloyl-ACP methyl ester carboxylesterase
MTQGRRMKLAVREWGQAGDVPIVFWHALGRAPSGADFATVGRVLAGAGFHVLAVDGPGFGRSPLLPADGYRLDSLVAGLYGVLDEHDADRPVLVGHSWGGAIAVRYAAAHPDDVRALVLLDSGHIDYASLPDVELNRSPEDWVEEARSRSPERPEARGRAMCGLVEPVSVAWPVIAARELPTLLFLATEPPHVDQNREHIGRFEAAVPQAEVRWIDGATHGILADVGAPLGDEIATWLVAQGL